MTLNRIGWVRHWLLCITEGITKLRESVQLICFEMQTNGKAGQLGGHRQTRLGEMVPPVKAFAVKPDDLSLILTSNVVEGENSLLQVIHPLTSPHACLPVASMCR